MAKLSVGLDIGFSSIKAVALDIKSKPPKLISLGSIPAPIPGIVSDGETDLIAVAEAIKKLFSAAKIDTKDVIAALPESKVFTRVIDDLPFLNDNDLASAIRFASEEFIPMPITEVNLYWQVLSRTDKADNKTEVVSVGQNGQKSGRTVVFVIATPKNIINRYLKVFTLANLKPQAIETEIIASTRSIVGNNPFSPSTLIIQMGATTTDIAVVSKGLIWLTRSISTGGQALTRSIAQQFNFEIPQAEEYKKVYGMLEDQLEGKVFEAIKPVVDLIVTETKRVIQAFDMKYPHNAIKRVVLSGGGAKMPGLVVYFANNLGLEVQEADPWYFVGKDKSIISKLAQDGPLYSVAVGLALREE